MRGPCIFAFAGALAAASPAVCEPRPSGLRPEPASVEAGLWDMFDKAELAAKNSAELDTDPALNAYVGEVVCKVAANYCPEMRIYVLDRPFLNATVAANGYVEVWSGLLLRAQDEAELAYVLGHEVTHFAEGHSLQRLQARKNRGNVALALSVGVAIAGVSSAAGAPTYDSAQSIMDATGNLIDVIYLGAVASLFAFSRANETEADREGLNRMAAAGYAPEAAPEIWRNTIAETAASDFDSVRRREAHGSLFATHPLTADRVDALSARIAELPQGGEFGRARHRAAIRPHLAAWLRDDLRRRDFGETLFVLDRLAGRNEDMGVINFFRGETYRLRRKDGDLELARSAYAAAAGYTDAPTETWRELGDISRRLGDPTTARDAYQSYLLKAPSAEDAWIVQDSLDALGGETVK